MIDILAILFVVLGFVAFFTATVGLLGFPDFYSRMHAAGKGDSYASLLMLIGLAIYNFNHISVNDVLVSIKIIFISVFIFLVSPTATHAIVDARFEMGVRPWTKRRRTKKKKVNPSKGELENK